MLSNGIMISAHVKMNCTLNSSILAKQNYQTKKETAAEQ
jgi:hypothetical protein